MWELDNKEAKNLCFWTVVLEKNLESPLDCKEIQPVHPKGDQSWIFVGRTDAEAETPILWLWLLLSHISRVPIDASPPGFHPWDSPGKNTGVGCHFLLQYFGYLMRRADSLEKTLMLGKIEGRRWRGRQRMRWLDDINNSMGMSLSKLRDFVMDRKAWGAVIHGVAKSQTWLGDWAATTLL